MLYILICILYNINNINIYINSILVCKSSIGIYGSLRISLVYYVDLT